MNLRELAEKDLGILLEGVGACNITFIDSKGQSHVVAGWVGDTGILFDTDGNPVAGRCVRATWRLSSLMQDGKYLEPSRGWSLYYTDMTGKEWLLYVTRFEPDRTAGIGRVFLSLDLSNDY